MEFIGRPNLPEGLAQMAAKLRAMVGQELGQGIAELGKGIGAGLGKKRDEEARRMADVRAEEAQRLDDFRSVIGNLIQQGQLSPQIGTGNLDMGALLPRLQSAMSLASGIGKPSPSIPLGGMTTKDLADLMSGRPGPVYTISEPVKRTAADALKSRIMVTKELAAKYKLPGDFIGREISSNVLLNKTFLGDKGSRADQALRTKALQYAYKDGDFLIAMDDGNIEDANAIVEMYLKVLRGEEDEPAGSPKKPKISALPGLTIE